MVSGSAYNQFCYVSVNPLDTTICPGDSVPVVAFGSLINSSQAFNFNTGTFPSGWTSTGSSFFSSPCGPSDIQPIAGADCWASSCPTSDRPMRRTVSGSTPIDLDEVELDPVASS